MRHKSRLGNGYGKLDRASGGAREGKGLKFYPQLQLRVLAIAFS